MTLLAVKKKRSAHGPPAALDEDHSGNPEEVEESRPQSNPRVFSAIPRPRLGQPPSRGRRTQGPAIRAEQQ